MRGQLSTETMRLGCIRSFVPCSLNLVWVPLPAFSGLLIGPERRLAALISVFAGKAARLSRPLAFE